VRTKLLGTQAFSTIDVFSADPAPPTVAQLAPYHVVLVFAKSPFGYNSVELCNSLAAYFDQGGGGVIAAMFNTACNESE
jgi:hypothetical protein